MKSENLSIVDAKWNFEAEKESAVVRIMETEHDLFEKFFKINDRGAKFNLDKIREHILKCIIALSSYCHRPEDKHEVMKQHVFCEAVHFLVKEDVRKRADVNLLVSQFAWQKETCSTCDWFPLHWAVVLGDRIKIEVVHALFRSSPS